MCIQWCCKHCPDNCTKLTHKWARERCNDFYIARSLNENITDCPKGPWELRRAFHRHPYRGAQRCDACKKAGKNKSKLAQSARKKANAAIGEMPEYTGALFLGELEIPDTFQQNAKRVLEPGKVDAMKLSWESFSLANGHLPSHELEREWAKRFTASSVVDLKAGGSVAQPYKSKLAFTLGRPRMSEEDHHDRGKSAALTGEVSQSPHQQIHHHGSESTAWKQNELSQGAHQHVQYNANSSTKRANSTTMEQEDSRSVHQHVQHKNSSSYTKTVKGASQNTHHHHQIYPNVNSETNKSSRTTVEEGKEAASRATHREMHHKSSLPTRSASSSQPTRARPWDL